MSSAKEKRKELLKGGSALTKHTMGASTMHWMVESERRFYKNDKGAKAQAGRERDDMFIEDFPVFQFERAITKLSDGQATDLDTAYLRRHDSEFVNSPLRIRGMRVVVVDFSGFQRRDYQEQPRISLEEYIEKLPLVEPSED